MKLIVLSLIVSLSVCAQTHTLSGVVLDAETLQPLPSATIRIIGTSRGTVSNADGHYRFSLPRGTATISASYLGYESDTVTLTVSGNMFQSFRLQPTAIQIAGVTVTDEDPAYEIIRRAIESKQKWMAQLNTFEARSFNRTQMRTDSSIAAIIEAYSILYWNRNDSLREVIIQKRQTGNLPAGGSGSRVGEVMNFNDDKIKQGGYTFYGPTAPNAFDYYDYKLLKTRSLDSYDIYDIQLIPRSSIVPLFKGTISIASRSYAVVEVDLQTNEAFSIPFIRIIRSSYKQSFGLFDEKYWLPVNFRNEAKMSISVMGIKFPAIDVERDIVIYEYKMNPEFPDSISRMKKITIDSSATRFDSTFWAEHDVLPLTAEQDTAYRILDSTQTLDKKFAPSGTAMTALSLMGSVSIADLWFNRVEGFHLGATTSFDSVLSDNLTIRGGVGYGVSDKQWKYTAGVTFRFGGDQTQGTPTGFANLQRSRKIFSITADLYDKHLHLPQSLFAGLFFNSFYALISKNDYYDYFRVKGLQTSLSYMPKPSLRLTATATAEQNLSLYQNTSFAWFAKNTTYRPHPRIVNGMMNTVKLSATYNPSGFIAFVKDAITVKGSIEHSPPFLASSFEFTQVNVNIRGKVSTLLREEVPMPPSLDMYLSFGLTNGGIPPQRYFTPETNLLGLISAGTLRGTQLREFYGDNFITLTIEHNFRRVLFSPIPSTWLKESNIDLIVGGTVSQYRLSRNVLRSSAFPAKEMNGWYFEAGIGLQNILDIFRIDVTRRFTAPDDVVLTLSVSDFFSGFIPEQ